MTQNYTYPEQTPATHTPTTASPLYIDIVQELREQTGGTPEGEPVGEPWEVRLPTPLVILQVEPDAATLPDWTVSEPGNGGG